MLNRTESSGNDALDIRRAIAVQLRESLQELPPAPFDWTSFDPVVALRNGSQAGHTPDLRLAALAKLLCSAPARGPELRALWNECVATAEFSLRLAPMLRADRDICAIAALLHRLGDLLTLRVIGTLEFAMRVRLDAASRADFCAEHGGELLDRTVRAWGVPARAAATAAEWRRLREFPSAAAEATVVYLARLFAIERLSPQFCALGMIEHACEEAGIEAAALESLRGDFGSTPVLV
jgi:HD-like signal output (HDOD) protein